MTINLIDSVHENSPIHIQWDQIDCSGTIPPGRAGFSASLHDNIVLIFGGGTLWTDGSVFNDLYTLDLKSWSWDEVQPVRMHGTIPSPRQGNSAVTMPDPKLMCLYGGSNGVENFNDIHIYNITSHIWSQPFVPGTRPRGSYGHSAHILPSLNNQLIVFGGSSWVNYIASVERATHK